MMNKKKVAMTIASCGLIAALGVSGFSLAYLTDAEQATNRFTVEGNLDVDLEEPDYPGNGSDEVKRITPNKEIAKNPQVRNTGMNPEVVFLRVTVPVDNITPVADDGTKGTRGLNELFWLKDATQTIGQHENKFDANWAELGAGNSFTSKEEVTVNGARSTLNTNPTSFAPGTTERTYVFGYKQILLPGHCSSALFDKVQLKNMLENDLGEGQVENIKIETFAIQATDVLDANGNDLTDNLTPENLASIYDRFITQGTYGQGAEAHAAGAQNITKPYANPKSADPALDEDGKTYEDKFYNQDIDEAHVSHEKDIYDNDPAQNSSTNLDNVTKTTPNGTAPETNANPYNETNDANNPAVPAGWPNPTP